MANRPANATSSTCEEHYFSLLQFYIKLHCDKVTGFQNSCREQELKGIHKVVVITIKLLPVTRASLPESNPIGDAINYTLIEQFVTIKLEENSVQND
jgi:hypothetical protein